jgi:hypothetical protein
MLDNPGRYLPPVSWPGAQAAVLKLSEMAADLAALRQQNEQLRNDRSPREETVRNLRECINEIYELRVEVDGARESDRRLSEKHQRAQDLLDGQLQQSLVQADGLRDQNAKLRTEVDRLKAIIENVKLAIEGVVEQPPSDADKQKAYPIEELELSVRGENCLKVNAREHPGIEIRTIGDLVKCTAGTLLRIPNFGRKTLREVNEALAARGMHLAEPG